ncbi:MAG: M20/M25/M40 family metallo-hydrolase [Hyphomicrobiales bacterium]|nr:M20/M25/M40 family metallo-hydrolase [Hyphomicrobiales bacterium]
MSTLDQVLARIDRDFDACLERLYAFIAIESISTDPAYKAACAEAAEWAAATLREIGFDITVHPTAGHPMVMGKYRPKGEVRGPHVLFYGHYDVQPVDPLELWERPPFEAHIGKRSGADCIFGRGSCDDKGQLMTFVEAARAIKAETGDLPFEITVLLEGEEESGSPSLMPFLEAHGDELKAEIALVCDTEMWDPQTPAITTRLRGLMSEEVVITGPDRDLHSGLFGGPAHNPIRVLMNILGQMHDADGRVAVPGFYDGVDDLPDAIKRQWDGLDFDGAGFLGGVGLSSGAGEAGRSMLEQLWSRPTLEFNGVIGGYTGTGTKTVIPSKASAKISCRLVGRQDPEAVRAAVRAFVTERLPAGVTVEFLGTEGSPAIEMPSEAPVFRQVAAALAEEWGRPAAMIGCGGSIPIVGDFKEMLGMDSVLVGFALDDDAVHSPNEKFSLSSYRGGVRSWARIIMALGDG